MWCKRLLVTRHDTPGRRPRYTAAVSTLSPSPLGITLPVESRWVCFFSESFPICMVYVTKMSFLQVVLVSIVYASSVASSDSESVVQLPGLGSHGVPQSPCII